MANSRIQFIYFDVGGVALLDFSKTNKWEQMLADLGLSEAQKSDFTELFRKYELEVCVGLELDSFIKAAREKLSIEFPSNYSMLKDFVSRFEPNLSLGSIIKSLESKYKLGLLTNMYPGMLDEIKKNGLLPETNWSAVIDSSMVKVRKPQPEIYKIAEDQAQVPVENILFVENSQSHIQAAQTRRWQTFLYDPANVAGSNKLLLELL